MSTSNKWFTAAAVTFALAIIVGFWPVQSFGLSCGSALKPVPVDILCGNPLETMMYPMLVLVMISVAVMLVGTWIRSGERDHDSS